MKFKIGDHVRILSDYPFDRMLQGATGNIVELPNAQHLDEYIVRLDGGITRSLYLKDKPIPVSGNWLKLELNTH
ncbi:MAG: hypothetical protein Q7T57_08645 [Dehalococcoidales bacterium]|nr:hypothetical protein [Dehalococcoidales bacterium]